MANILHIFTMEYTKILKNAISISMGGGTFLAVGVRGVTLDAFATP